MSDELEVKVKDEPISIEELTKPHDEKMEVASNVEEEPAKEPEEKTEPEEGKEQEPEPAEEKVEEPEQAKEPETEKIEEKPEKKDYWKPKKSRASKTIERLKRERNEANLRAARAEARAEGVQEGYKLAGIRPDAGVEQDPRPKLDNFDDEEKFREAETRWIFRQEIKKEAPKEPEEPKEPVVPENVRELNEAIGEINEDGKDKYPDYEEVAMDKHLPITVPMLRALPGIENAEDVTYYLGQNPQEAFRIAKAVDRSANPVETARKLFAEIESKTTSTEPTKPKEPKVKKVTDAEEPLSSVKGTGSETVVDLNSGKVPIDDLAKSMKLNLKNPLD